LLDGEWEKAPWGVFEFYLSEPVKSNDETTPYLKVFAKVKNRECRNCTDSGFAVSDGTLNNAIYLDI
jgi:hypothetical protein